MKKIIFVMLMVILTAALYAKEYYIGDVLKFNISGVTSEDEVKKGFSEFEDVKIEKDGMEYRVEARTYIPGKKNILINGKKSEIVVKSLLGGNEQEIAETYVSNEKESDKNFKNRGYFAFPVTYAAVFAGILLFIIIIYLILKKIKKGNKGIKLFRESINRGLKEDYYVTAVRAVKVYFAEITGENYLDLTTSEFFARVQYKISEICNKEELDEIKQLFEEADLIKFQGSAVELKDKTAHKDKLVKIMENIEKQRVMNNKKGAKRC